MNLNDPATTAILNRLLEQTSRGNHREFEQFYRLTAGKMLGIALRMLGDRGDAEDVLQETFIAVWQSAASFNSTRANALTWLTALLRHKAINRIRRRRLERRYCIGNEEAIDDSSTPALEAEHSELCRRLQNCLQQLQPEHQRSLREAFFTGITHQELATRRGVPLGTMKSWIRRGLAQLRRRLDQ